MTARPKKTEVILKQDDAAPVPVEVMADAIMAIAKGVRKLRAGPLNDRALILLIQHAAPTFGSYPRQSVGPKHIRAVLDGIDGLEREYLKRPKVK